MATDQLAEFDDPNDPNVPQAMAGSGLSGPRVHVPPAEARERRSLMSTMLINGAAVDNVTSVFATKYGLNEVGVRHLITEVQAMWEDDDADATRYAKNKARRRIHSHIREAAKDRKWTAVANLEGVLADVEGTNVHEDDQPIDVDSRLTEAILGVLNATDTREVRILIESQRAYIELGARDGTLDPVKKLKPGEVIVEAPSG